MKPYHQTGKEIDEEHGQQFAVDILGYPATLIHTRAELNQLRKVLTERKPT